MLVSCFAVLIKVLTAFFILTSSLPVSTFVDVYIWALYCDNSDFVEFKFGAF